MIPTNDIYKLSSRNNDDLLIADRYNVDQLRILIPVYVTCFIRKDRRTYNQEKLVNISVCIIQHINAMCCGFS